VNRKLGLSLLLAATAMVALPRPAAAWDSICYGYADANAKVGALAFTPDSRGCEGIEAARGRWRDPERQVDEHRRIFELAAGQAGLPASVLETTSLAVLTGPASTVVAGANGATRAVDVKAPGSAEAAVLRSFALDELAQLPDFSFSLWDWARGNETCPLKPLPAPFDQAQTCHAFASHMGSTNSNHFPPQSDTWFDHYHQLAMDRAAECRTTRAAIWDVEPVNRRLATDARLATYFRACEVEALAYEAVAQHFLQDSWSAGHMWQRWGSTNLDAFPATLAVGTDAEDLAWNGYPTRFRRLLIAEITAASAGTIHGSDPALFEKTDQWLTLHDPMCFPHDDVMAVDNGTLRQVVGDLHLHDVVGGPPTHLSVSLSFLPYDTATLGGQSQKLLGCAAGSLGAVYFELSDPTRFGAPALGAAMASPPPFDVNACRAPQATNLAINRGIDATDLQPALGEDAAALADIPDSIEASARNDYGRLRHAAMVLAKVKPEGTELSTLHLTETFSYSEEFCSEDFGCATVTYSAVPTLFTMMTMEPNRCYSTAPNTGCIVPPPAAGPLSPFVDPALAAQLPAPDPNDPGGALALAFHASRAAQLCDAVSAADLAALPSITENAGSGVERAAACDACAEWIAPFLRVGKDMTDYDQTAEPLCHFTSAAPDTVPYVYEPGTGTADLMALARRKCGCRGLVAVTDAGLRRLQVATSANAAEITQIGPTVPVGTLPRDVAAASGGRLLVANGAGQIVGVRGDVEIDLDGNAGNGVTRLTFSGIGDLQGIAVVNAAGKELVLGAATGTGELVAYDLTTSTLCERFSVAQVAGQVPYDVVVSGDGSKVWLSLRRTSPLSGALASVSLPALAQCNGTAQATLQWLAPPGAASGLGPMALSPDGAKLAVGGRLGSACLDQVHTASGQQQDTQVGCDRVYVLDVATNTWKTFGSNLSMPTRPGRYPYGVAWFQDSIRMAFSTFQGIDNGGNGDSGWPAAAAAMPRIPIGGTLRIADTSGASYQGGGSGIARHWSYNMPLQGFVIGPTVVVDGGAFYGAGWVFVGSGSGRVSAYSVAPHDAALDPMWEASEADPETLLHASTNGSWYGGCRHTCGLPGGVCPDVCPNAMPPAGFGKIELGSGVRVLAAY